jgi:hypothetical protein
MALPAQRHEEIDSTLREICKYLLAIAHEIDDAGPKSERHGCTYQVALNTAAQITELRRTLWNAQGDHWEGKELRQLQEDRQA